MLTTLILALTLSASTPAADRCSADLLRANQSLAAARTAEARANFAMDVDLLEVARQLKDAATESQRTALQSCTVTEKRPETQANPFDTEADPFEPTAAADPALSDPDLAAMMLVFGQAEVPRDLFSDGPDGGVQAAK